MIYLWATVRAYNVKSGSVSYMRQSGTNGVTGRDCRIRGRYAILCVAVLVSSNECRYAVSSRASSAALSSQDFVDVSTI